MILGSCRVFPTFVHMDFRRILFRIVTFFSNFENSYVGVNLE